MKPDQEFERLFRQEFRNIMPNTIWQTDDGVYEVFGHYRIQPERPGYRVFCSATDVGIFSSTRTALSWCIADKNRAYNTARELLTVDNKLSALTHDITARAALGDRSLNPGLREIVLTKLESKIIQKKLLENQLTKCVNWAKYIQQRGFDNETARTGRSQSNKTSR
jgi:GTPase SAR1 family protein